MHYTFLFVVSLILFIASDLLWLGVVAKNFYHTRLAHLLGDVVWLPAIIFYGIFIFGLTYFVTAPYMVDTPYRIVALNGAIFGLVTYATYDLTNHATLREWPLSVTLVDILWGTVLGAFVATLSVYAYRLWVV